MKLGMREHTDLSAGVQDEVAISFEANAVAFYAQISGLAKDKIGYPIRELSTNAWDASRGNFEVQLPTTINPTFRVRDYGPGMSAEQMVEVYARLYASTKRGSNDEVGGWGLGSKSPFAYLIGDNGAGSYTVSSYHGGMMRTYVLSLSAGGSPVMRLLAEAPSDAPSGLEVSFPVRRDDISAFNQRARTILWSFEPRPKVTPALSWEEPVITASGDNWTKYRRGVPFIGPHVRMGCVMYPFDLRQIETSGFLDQSDDVLFEAPIGSLKVTLSREELAYDDRTKETLQTLVKEYEDSFIDQLRVKLAECDSYFAACRVFQRETEGLGAYRQDRLRGLVAWNGLRPQNTIRIANAKMMAFRNHTPDKFENSGGIAVNYLRNETKVAIEHNPSYSIQRLAAAGLAGQDVLWIRCKRVDRDQVLSEIGNPDVIDLDNFKIEPTEKRKKTVRKRRTLVAPSEGGRNTHRVTQDVDLAEGGLYVQGMGVRGWGRTRGDYFYYQEMNDTSCYVLEDVIKTCVELRILDPETVILIKTPDEELGENWTWLGDDIIQGLRDRIDLSQFTGLHNKDRSDIPNDIRTLITRCDLRTAPDDLREFYLEARQLHNDLGAARPSTDSDKAFEALKSLGQQVDIPQVDCPISKIRVRYAALTNRYRLLSMILDKHGSGWNRSDPNPDLRHYFSLLRGATPVEESPVIVNEDEKIEIDEDDNDELVAALAA
jgi:hypothetical protein